MPLTARRPAAEPSLRLLKALFLDLRGCGGDKERFGDVIGDM